MDFHIGKTEVYGVEYAIKASGNPMRTTFNRDPLTEKDMSRAILLGSCKSGEGHDNYLKGCVVEFDITAPLFSVCCQTNHNICHLLYYGKCR